MQRHKKWCNGLFQQNSHSCLCFCVVQGEMSATVFYYPKSYVKLLPDLRQRLSAGLATSDNIRLGVSTNFDKLCGCVLQVQPACVSRLVLHALILVHVLCMCLCLQVFISAAEATAAVAGINRVSPTADSWPVRSPAVAERVWVDAKLWRLPSGEVPAVADNV